MFQENLPSGSEDICEINLTHSHTHIHILGHVLTYPQSCTSGNPGVSHHLLDPETSDYGKLRVLMASVSCKYLNWQFSHRS